MKVYKLSVEYKSDEFSGYREVIIGMYMNKDRAMLVRDTIEHYDILCGRVVQYFIEEIDVVE